MSFGPKIKIFANLKTQFQPGYVAEFTLLSLQGLMNGQFLQMDGGELPMA